MEGSSVQLGDESCMEASKIRSCSSQIVLTMQEVSRQAFCFVLFCFFFILLYS